MLTAVAGTDMARDNPGAKYCMSQYLGTKKTIWLIYFSRVEALSCKLNRGAIQSDGCPLTLWFAGLFESRIREYSVFLFPSHAGKNPETGRSARILSRDRITQYLQNRVSVCVAGSREHHAGIPRGLPHLVRYLMRYAHAEVARH